ncbi:Uncharacterised protein [Vibrio cholerae]|nr:Uncharacterised protein [Vibrio cholerae]
MFAIPRISQYLTLLLSKQRIKSQQSEGSKTRQRQFFKRKRDLFNRRGSRKGFEQQSAADQRPIWHSALIVIKQTQR